MNIDLEFTSSPVHLAQVPTENPYAGDYYAYYGGVINGFYRVLEYMNNTGAAGYPIPGTTINGSSDMSTIIANTQAAYDYDPFANPLGSY